MVKIYKSESYLFFLAIILLLLTQKAGLPHIAYLLYSILLAMFFFPTKPMIKYSTEPLVPMIISSFSIFWLLIYANVSYYLAPNIFLQMFLFVISLVNLIMLYYFYKKKNDSMALHLLAFAIIPMILM